MSYRLTLCLISIISLLFAQNSATTIVLPNGQVRQLPQQPTPDQQQQQPQKEEPPASLEGQVVNAVTGEPIKKASILLNPAQPKQDATSYSTITDVNGHFGMSNISPGAYRLSSERTGFVRGEYGSAGPMRVGITLTLSASQEMKISTFKLQPHAVISGRVLDEDGEVMANVLVQAMTHRYVQGKRQLVPAGSSSTNDLGEYRIFGLGPGRYYLSANYRNQQMGWMAVDHTAGVAPNAPEEGYALTYYPGTMDPGGAMPIVVAAGRSMSNMDIKLMRTHTVRIRGRVTNAGSQGAMRTMIMLAPKDPYGFGLYDRSPTSVRGKEGKFEFRGVTPGSYQLIAQYMEDNNRYMARVPVDVGNTNVEGLEVTFKPMMEISGTVVVEGNNADVNVALLNVSLQPKEFSPMGGGGGSRVKEDGTFTIRSISADTFRATIFGGGDQVYLKSVQVGQQEVKNGEFTVVDDAPPTVRLVLSVAGAQVSGHVTGEKQEPIQGATVVLVPAVEKRDQPQLFKTATTDQNGSFTLKSIAPGDYKLFSWDSVEQGAWQDPEFLAQFENKGKTVSFKENDQSTADLELIKTGDSQLPQSAGSR